MEKTREELQAELNRVNEAIDRAREILMTTPAGDLVVEELLDALGLDETGHRE